MKFDTGVVLEFVFVSVFINVRVLNMCVYARMLGISNQVMCMHE